jgi:hypothetical protein
MTALNIAIQEHYPGHFHYGIANQLFRAIDRMQWDDSLGWWAHLGASGFHSKYRHCHPMPEDLISAIAEARKLIPANKQGTNDKIY